MISCRDAVRQLWEYLDDDLDPGDQQQVDQHLAQCRRCCGEVEFTEALRRMLRSAGAPALPPEVETHLVGFLDTLHLEGEKP